MKTIPLFHIRRFGVETVFDRRLFPFSRPRGTPTPNGLWTMAILAFAAAVMLSGAGCSTTGPAAGAPSLVPPSWEPAENPNPFGGFIYPGEGDNAGFLELDAPLRTLVQEAQEHLGFGPEYFAFTVNVRVRGLRILEMTLAAAGAQPVAVQQVDGPCDPVSGPAARDLMLQTGQRETGVRTEAAYDLIINQRLADGEPLWFVTCEPGRDGEVHGNVGGQNVVDYHVAVLLPKSALGSHGRGDLTIRSKPVVASAGTISDPLVLRLVTGPPLMGVVGDSMVWGQGLGLTQKFWFLTHREITQRTDREPRLHVLAHSSARLQQGDSESIADAQEDCRPPENDAGDRELPFGAPPVQCQLARIALPFCHIDAASLDQPGIVPRMVCSPRASTAPVSLADPQPIRMNHGPRYDWLLMNGCINDVRAVWLHTDISTTIVDVTARVSDECNLANRLPDLRQAFPNAHIAYLGYHRTWSDSSTVLTLLTCPSVTALAPAGLALVYPFTFFGFPNPVWAAQQIAARVSVFWTGSNGLLGASAAGLTDSAQGRGTLHFVPLNFYTEDTAAYAGNSLNWELDCIQPAPPLGPLDTVRNQRAASCTAAINAMTLNDLLQTTDWINTDWSAESQKNAALEFCLRGSFLHPNAEGNQRMSEAVIQRFTTAGLLP